MTKETIVDWQGTIIELKPGTLFHWVAPGSFLLHNVKLGKGVFTSVSAIAQMPGLENATTPYAAYNQNPEKEKEWERVRTESYASRPSRIKALYCFDNEELAQRAKREWFANENRRLVKLRLTAGTKSWKADTKLLDGPNDKWTDNAVRYWRGDMTADPFPETIVHGQVYFPDWESFELAFPQQNSN